MEYADLSLTTPDAAVSSSSSSSCTSESSVSTSSDSSFSNISSTNLPNPTVISTPKASSANSVFKTYASNYAAPYSSNMNVSMTSSTSQIFATAASFNISSLDTVFYSRETIHYLAKFLSLHSKDVLFSSLYAFAPDNLAWLWSFIDWDAELDLNKIETQDTFSSFKTISNAPISNQQESDVKLSDEQICLINKIYSESPLVRYVYREKMMIADVFKLLEHVQNIQDENIAKSLFVLYFPRFSGFIENPLKSSIAPKILKVNLSRVKSVDGILVSLVRTRYTNLNEYKLKIKEGIDLPSYIRTLLDENNYWSKLDKQEEATKNKHSKNKTNAINISLHNESSESNTSSMQNSFEQPKLKVNTCIQPIQMQNENLFPTLPDENYTNLVQSLRQNPSTKTNDYLNLLEKCSQINDSLDHVSFDTRLVHQQQHNHQLPELNDLNTMVSDHINQNQSIFLMSPNSQRLYQQQNHLRQNAFDYGQNKKVDVSSRTSNIQSINEEEYAYIDEENPTENEQMYRCIANSKLRATASAFKVDPNKSYATTNEIQGLDKLQINPQTSKYAKKFYNQDYSSSKSGFLINSPLSPNHTADSNESFVWSNNNNNFNNSFGRGSYKNNYTPPPSAKAIQTPLSILTNSSNIDELNIYNFTSPNVGGQNFNHTSPFPSNSRTKYDQPFHTESMKYIKASTFLSPAIRQNLNTSKFSEFSNITSSSNSSGQNSLNGSKFNLNKNGNDFQSYGNSSLKRNDFAPTSESYSPRGNTTNQNSSFYINKNATTLHHVWFGRLPPKVYSENALYSRKVFLGGLPWDVNQQHLVQMLHKYGPVKLEIPGKDQKHPRASTMCKTQERSTPGYVYIIFEHESSVQRMLLDCRKEIKNGGEHYYYTIFVQSLAAHSSTAVSPIPYQDNFNFNFSNHKRSKAKEVEVIPWNQEDTSYMPYKTVNQPSKIDARLTVFVGALHGMLNAQGLAKVMNEIIGEVTHAGLDSDKYKYPIGSGRVTFKNRQSYVKAISAKFVTIKANLDPHDPSPKFEKTIQIDPYLEDAKCCQCDDKSFFFCRNEYCLDYYCQDCWSTKHETKGNGEHLPISRQNKPNHGC